MVNSSNIEVNTYTFNYQYEKIALIISTILSLTYAVLSLFEIETFIFLDAFLIPSIAKSYPIQIFSVFIACAVLLEIAYYSIQTHPFISGITTLIVSIASFFLMNYLVFVFTVISGVLIIVKCTTPSES